MHRRRMQCAVAPYHQELATTVTITVTVAMVVVVMFSSTGIYLLTCSPAACSEVPLYVATEACIASTCGLSECHGQRYRMLVSPCTTAGSSISDQVASAVQFKFRRIDLSYGAVLVSVEGLVQ